MGIGVKVAVAVGLGRKLSWEGAQAEIAPPSVANPAKRRKARRDNARRSTIGGIEQRGFLVRPPGDGDQLIAIAAELVQVVGAINGLDHKAGVAQE